MRRDPARNLGRTQRLVLHLLASTGASTVRELSYHWPSLTESAAAGAVSRLADRGLVDAADRDWQGACSYTLSERGHKVEATLIAPQDEDDDG